MTAQGGHAPPADVARDLLAEAESRGLMLRLGGSLAVRGHCAGTARLLEAWGREAPADIDFFGYHAEHRELERLFEDLEYRLDPAIAHSREYGVNRLLYHRADGLKVDIFLDVLRMAHSIDFKDRLPIASPTLSVADLALTKLQIHEFTAKDVKDLAALLSQHELSDAQEPESIEVPRLVRVLARDWGFWCTATTNLETVGEFLAEKGGARSRVDQLREHIDSAAKTTKWRMRARIGTRAQWYADVDPVEQGGF